MSESTSSTPSATPTPTRPAVSAEALNRASDAARTARASDAVKASAPSAPVKAAKRASKARAPKTPAPVKAPAPTGRKALTTAERAARPVTTTIAAYVDYLVRAIPPTTDLPGVSGAGRKFGKLSARDRALLGLAITNYGAYQISPERRKARLG
jgi:hypothetical protein